MSVLGVGKQILIACTCLSSTAIMRRIRIPTPILIAKEISLVGSCRKEVWQMLDFATFHKIKPVVEQFPMTHSGVTEALEKMRKGEMRYRGVLRI